MKILVADDDPTSRLIVETALRMLGHDCESVPDGEHAWEAFLATRPDLVISDWMMPGMDGLELCRKIRADTSSGYTYFIMVTGQGSLDEVLEGMGAGADDYLVKPLDTDELQARLVAATRITALHTELAVQRHQLEGLNEELMSVARRDQLTGLRNRRALDEDLALLEAQVQRYGHRYSMGLIDVDLFKSYNDTYGHLAGDQILQTVASELEQQARGGDAIYRYGGEEFLVIFPEQTLANATMAVRRMRLGLAGMEIPHLGSPMGKLTISAGVAVLDPDHIRSASEVLHEADEALYRAKALGRNRVERAGGADFSDPVSRSISKIQGPDTTSQVSTERVLEIIQDHDLEIVYQPIVRFADRKVIGVEALARFSGDPVMSPDRWFGAAAELGLGTELELTAIEVALEGVAGTPPEMKLGVNLSPETATSKELRGLLRAVDARRVVLEITEHASVEHYDELMSALGPLRELGAMVAIDDAGAGFASFRHILNLEPDVIKLDLSLTRNIDTKPRHQQLTRSLVAFAADTGADVLAEGIETFEELETLIGLGVFLGQGYYLGRPGPISTLEMMEREASSV